MGRGIALTLAKITDMLDEHGLEERNQAMAFLRMRYPEMTDADREYERARKAEYRDRERDSPVGQSQGQEGHPVPICINGLGSKASKAVLRKEVTAEQLQRAEGTLEPDDFKFLAACPEPFRTAWLQEPDWWVSLRDGYPRVAAQREASKCMSWVQAKFKPGQIERLNLRERLRRWFAKADMWRISSEERQAVRR